MFTKNRDWLLTTDVARKVLAAILAHRDVAPLLSDEHFPVDGTPVKAFAMGLEPMATLTCSIRLRGDRRLRPRGCCAPV